MRRRWKPILIAAPIVAVILAIAAAIAIPIIQKANTPVSGYVGRFIPLDSSYVRFEVAFTNNGTSRAVKVQCTFNAYDLGGRIIGTDYLTTSSEIQPGETIQNNGTLRIEDFGALRIARIAAEDCKAA